ncbi:lymphotoxin-alpha-like [Embiotoca jacksoni]|uniref:lymphotoxin-alpha-like n=1 Tax=Embiotoca jacksoni TaxID=100190 RepID=UPI003703CD44
MEMLDVNRQLIHEWEAGGMEDDAGDAEGLHQRKIQALLQKQKRLQWIFRFSIAALLLLFTGSLVLFVAAGREGSCTSQCEDKRPSKFSLSGHTLKQTTADWGRPSAFLTAPVGDKSNGTVLLWSDSVDHAMCKGGFEYNNGRLTVPKTGLYRVFLQITYNRLNTGCPDTTHVLYNELLHEPRSHSGKKILVKTVETMSVNKNEPWRKSIYTSGIFSLDVSDELYVIANHPECITSEQHEVFFGVELLPD